MLVTVKTHASHSWETLRVAWNRPFPNCLLPLFQNESWCTTIEIEMSLICKTMNVQVKLIWFSIWMVVHQDSFWNRGKWQLGNGLLLNMICTHTNSLWYSICLFHQFHRLECAQHFSCEIAAFPVDQSVDNAIRQINRDPLWTNSATLSTE